MKHQLAPLKNMRKYKHTYKHAEMSVLIPCTVYQQRGSVKKSEELCKIKQETHMVRLKHYSDCTCFSV